MNKEEKNNKKQDTIVDDKKNIFYYKELKQSDLKMSNYAWINPIYNPGCLKRLKSNQNKFKKYTVQKELFYMKDSKKITVPIGEVINFISPKKHQLQNL